MEKKKEVAFASRRIVIGFEKKLRHDGKKSTMRYSAGNAD
jgi:hypothetical protein